MLLNAIPDSYSDVKFAIKYGSHIQHCCDALKIKELDLKHDSDAQEFDKVMHVRGGNWEVS